MSEINEAAEMDKRVEALMAELAEARAKSDRMEAQLDSKEQEQELMRRLSAEGTKDLEAAVAIAKARISGDNTAELGAIVEQLRKEKGYLFNEKEVTAATMRTSPAKEQRNGAGSLERAAKKAAGTGSRSDLQVYMKRRRSIV